ncbi:hypothetical protein RF11_08439 [Thelohanellus kitauei]|uniref:Uncharacterized protein n=1 Tax=Thelohanellus kitauei TaxID=669202 RepID=A0A0C2MTB2_THEKT|nr:hypothetical protein RF11_08439 [Thelohanellus kitauei]
MASCESKSPSVSTSSKARGGPYGLLDVNFKILVDARGNGKAKAIECGAGIMNVFMMKKYGFHDDQPCRPKSLVANEGEALCYLPFTEADGVNLPVSYENVMSLKTAPTLSDSRGEADGRKTLSYPQIKMNMDSKDKKTANEAKIYPIQHGLRLELQGGKR